MMSRMLPPYCSDDIQSNAEKRIFEMFRRAPDTTDWVCLHSLGLSRHVRQVYGEIDFIVLAPGEGVFCLEVKGGRVGRQEGIWLFTNRYGETTRSARSPFMQARDGMFTLHRMIVTHFGREHRLANILFGYGVLFPDVIWEQEDPEYERWQIYDRSFRRPISEFIRQLSRSTHAHLRNQLWYGSQDTRPTMKDIQELTDFLRGDFETVVRPSAQAEAIEKDLLRLTEEQYHCLDALQENPRCLFEGGAGTGKTLLAMEYARREARIGRRTLLLCYNRMLGQWMKTRLQGDVNLSLHAGSFHRYLDSLIAQSKYASKFAELRDAAGETGVTQEFYRQDYPLLAMEAISENVVEPFDSLVVDEGQDLICAEYLDVLDAMVRGGIAGGKWAIFCDFHRQAIFTDTSPDEMQSLIRQYAPNHVRYRLTINCRNTRPIIEETAAITGFDSLPCLPSCIEGVSVEYIFYRDPEHQRRAIVQLVHRMLEEGFLPGQISILSRVRRENSCLATTPEELRCRIENLDENNVARPSKGAILFSTIHAFKGLENTIVILTDIERLSGDHEAALLYVGMSRARQRLFMLVSVSAKREYEAAVRKKMQKEIART